MRRRWLVAAGLVPLLLVVWWLRDPGWLGDYTEGLGAVEVGDTGRAFRWTRGRASFYVPSTWAVADLEMAGPTDYRTQASIYVDGRLRGRLLLDDRWQAVPVATGTVPTSRRYRRIDVHVARTGDDQRGVRLAWPPRERRERREQ